MSLTAAQNEAIAARGNVLVVAGAGTGKTRTLVERCLACLVTEHPRTALDEILLVTFTEAAAAEMRQRIRSRIEQESARNPRDPHWQEQLALFETAHLGTIHSFCFELVRSHFYELELDPQLSILPEEEARLLAEETLDRVLQAHYGGKGGTAQTVQQLIQAQAKGSDQPIRTLVLRLHKHIRALPDAEEWLRSQSAVFANPVPELWRTWLGDAVADWRECSLPTLGQYREGNGVAKQCFGILADLPPRHSLAQAATALAGVLAAEKNCPHGKKKHWIKPLEDFFTNCRFLLSLLPADGQPDPLHQDWDWVRGQMSALLGLAGEFGAAFLEAKKELGVLDFQDLEQYALKLLWDTATGKPTSVAVLWRQNLRFVFVDEYQDVNAAQDKIIQALSREGAGANRFLVGDVKQSIYRFRLANPHIFQGYIENWRNGPGRVIPLQENFRSRKEILEFVNSLSSFLMHRELGGIDYDERARLLFGERDDGAKDVPPSGSTAVEIQLRVKGDPRDENDDLENPEAATELADLEEAGKEARSIALRVQALKTAGHLVRDEKEGRFRAVEWRDISILLRAPSNKAESYAKEFARLDVPLEVARGGFYDSLEIADLLSLLQVLDNPLQDLPLLALLRSPLVGLTLDDLAELRLAARRTSFWTALVRWSELNSPQSAARQSAVGGPIGCASVANEPPKAAANDLQPSPGSSSGAATAPDLSAKVSRFLDRFARWRRIARQVALSRCLETVLAETQYADWVATQPRGEQRRANLKRLLLLAQRFDLMQRQGLFRFLRFVEAQRRVETEPELRAVNVANAVRLMSIHQSKGLEFPVVVLADLGKPFNLADLGSEIILDERYGLCPQVKPPQTGKRYPSLPHWLAARRQKRELLGEELRLLYVALTRAKDLLILSASVSRQSFGLWWSLNENAPSPQLDKARSLSDWLGAWFCQTVPQPAPPADEGGLVRWTINDDRALAASGANARRDTEAPATIQELAPDAWKELERRFARAYPFTTSTRLPAKTSVSVLRQRVIPGEDDQGRSVPFAPGLPGTSTVFPRRSRFQAGRSGIPDGITAAEVGTAHHKFLQLVDLDRTLDAEHLRHEAERLVRTGALKAEYPGLLDFKAVGRFWNSSLGHRIRAQSAFVKRELPFTFRLGAADFALLTREPPGAVAPDDFVVVQGVADLAVIRPQEIWLVDFKTDRITQEEALAANGYEQQLKLYARGLSLIYRRPVTEAWLHYLSIDHSVPVAVG